VNLSIQSIAKFSLQLATLLVLSASMAFATTVTIPAGTGTLTFTQLPIVTQHHCVDGGTGELARYLNTLFFYTDPFGNITLLIGSASYTYNSCTDSSSGQTVTLTSLQWSIGYTTQINGPNGVVTSVTPNK
jgi:hypothetical protein